MNKNWNVIILIINFFTLIGMLFTYYFMEPMLNDSFVIIILSITVILTILFYLKSENESILRNNFFKHSNLVLIGLLTVNFQKYLDYLLNYIYETDLLLGVSQATGIKSLLLALIGLICFFIGYLVKMPLNYNKAVAVTKLTNTTFLSLIAITCLVGFILTVNPAYVLGGYAIYDMGLMAVYFSVLFKASYFALAIQKFINLKVRNCSVSGLFSFIKQMGIFNLLILFIYLIIVLLSGDRGDIIAFSLLILMGYMLVTGKKFGLIKSTVMILIASTFITLLGIARSFNVESNLSFGEKITRAIAGESNLGKVDSILPVTAELAGSVKALLYSVEFVPSMYDYFYGRFQLQAIFSIFPFSNSINEIIFKDNSSKNTSSDSYVTWLIEGDYALTGHGTSILADFYLSFGVLGVVVGMLFFGWLVRYSEQQTRIEDSRALLGIIVSVVIFCFSIYLARSSLFSFFRLIIWIWILLSLNRWFLKNIKRIV